ncbi:iron-siderophore ABC transporter substrate-binding protein [Oryzobacter telluris]|uniref:iron-siderophore ABC transporter substrate-binding protein n=1 Tax=Oryzobacter telluris TaxID=3149179 RepID=UPI00370D3A63
MPSRRHVLAAAPAAALLALAACSTGPSGGSAATSGTGASAAAAAYPVTVTHAHGSTTIAKPPTRIATIGWADADVVTALGITPVGAPKITWGGNAKGSTDWFDAQLTKIGATDGDVTRYDDSAGIPFDAIAATRPDLILGLSSGVSKEEYDKLSKIAPVVAYTKAPWGTPWQDQLATIGTALGKDAEAARLKADTEKTIADALAAHPEVKGKSAAWAWFSPTDLSTIGLYTTSDLRPQMLREFGFVDSPTVVDLSEADPSAFSVNLSAEKASTLDADLVVFYAEEGAGADAITGNALLGQIPALKSKQYVASADNAVALSMSLPSPLSVRTAVEKFLPKIVSALNGTPAS